MEPLLHENTRGQLARFIVKPGHALMLKGTVGAGKEYISQWLTQQILELNSLDKITSYPYISVIRPEKSVITILQIRELKQFMQLKTTGRNSIRRVVCIIDAHFMTLEAQNALLKILEEPPEDSVIIMTVNEDSSLKETVFSRVQKITVLPATRTKSTQYFSTYDKDIVAKAHALSGGNAGLMYALLHESDDHPLAIAIRDAKKIITSSTYQRLLLVDSLSKNKQALWDTLFALKRIATVGLQQAGTKSDHEAISKWQGILTSTLQSESSLRSNPNPKLTLTNLFLQM